MDPTANPVGANPVANPVAPLPGAPAAPSARLEALEAAVQRLAGVRPPDLLLQLARAFHFGTPLSYFTGQSDEELARELVEAFDFVNTRAAREIRVRVQPVSADRELIQATLRDQPFLLDSAREALRSLDVRIRRYLHPILKTERDAAHRLLAVRPRTGAGQAESFLHFEVEAFPDAAARERVERELRESLREAAMAADDYPQIRAAVESMARALRAERPADPALLGQLEEAADFLRWLLQGNFIFLGYRAYDFEKRQGTVWVSVTPRTALGILRDTSTSSFAKPVPLDHIEQAVRSRMVQKIFPLVSRTNRISRVHRRAPMDYIGIKKLSPSGEVVGEHRIIGFFTSQALNQRGSDIPVLRRKLERILARAEVLEGSHDYKEIVSIFNGLPKAELLATNEEEIARTIETVIDMESREGIRVDCRRDNLGRGASVMVLLPRDRFNSEVRGRIQALFTQRFGSPPADYRLVLGEERHARMHFYFPIAGSALPPAEVLEHDVYQAARTWEDGLREELSARWGPEQGTEIAERFASALPSSYRAVFDPAGAVDDLAILAELGQREGVRIRIGPGPVRGREGTTLLRLYRTGVKFYLSDIMPILANLGLRVLDELTFRLGQSPGPMVYLHTIRVQEVRRNGEAVPLESARWPAVTEAVLSLLDGRYENDGLAALVIAGLGIRQVEVLRAYIHFFRQLRVPYTNASMISALTESPEVAKKLVEHFELKFRPEPGSGPLQAARQRAELLETSRREILRLLDRVQDLTRDRILRGILELVEATVRTDYFRDGLPRLSLKLESRRISFMPRPVPLYEIFVHNAEMEGVHLRSGKVARGGIRWSDRRDDYRTEILGLMRTQQVKNAVIVPVGSKGGFILKRALDSREDQSAQVARQYRTLISGMLDLTDNLVGGKVVHPAGLVIYDEPDPYLVVAADKGTASFSDLANSIAQEHGFWLGDSFASGGSHGYDHKKEGITARGAWECASHHLRELGIDPQGEITVAGIGDMSGDVFGNGLLLSRKFKLVAAFDHRHVFLDPQPDLEASYEERKRLFQLPRSSWLDYNPKLISRGGGVYSRDQKRIDLTAEARALLRATVEAMTGEELVREVLKMPVDLLWNGGIGTYVKGSAESHAEVGDSRNDAYRVDGAELRAKVVAEGGNLGFTQLGRVEYAARGGKINTDFIDNSAGVDLSDHEVNIKIALAEASRAGKLDAAGRDPLLREMTSEVCGLVLLHNRQHVQILSLEEAMSHQDLFDHLGVSQELAEEGLLEAKFERFPDAQEMHRRAERRLGLFRPELAILLALTKIQLSRSLRESALVETAGFEEYLTGYFPRPMRERLGETLRAHPLRREIAVSSLVNELVYRVGVAFVSRFRRELGSSVEEVARAWRVADLLLEGESYAAPVRDLLAAGDLPGSAASELLILYRTACDDLVYWLLRTWPAGKEGGRASAAEVLKWLQAPFRKALAWIAGGAPPRLREGLAAREEELSSLGAPRDLAARGARLDLERHLLPVVSAARQASKEVEATAALYFALGGALRLGEAERAAGEIRVGDPDDRGAARALLAELRSLLVDLTGQALAAGETPHAEAERVAEAFLAARSSSLAAYRRAVPTHGRPFGLGSLMVLVERLRRLVAG